MNNIKKWIFLLGCFLVSITFSTIVTAKELEIPNFIKDIPFVGAFAATLGLFLCCILFFLPLIIAILACIWIYKDAERRGKEGILWVILLLLATIVFNIVGFIVVIILWLVVRPKK